MEREAFFSGYCRVIDGSRMVTVEAEGSTLTDVGCAFENCPNSKNCPIAEKIEAFLKEE